MLPEQGSSGLHASTLHLNKSKNPSKSENEVANEESISDADLDNIVGVGDNSELEVSAFILYPLCFDLPLPIASKVLRDSLFCRKWSPLVHFSVNFALTRSRLFTG